MDDPAPRFVAHAKSDPRQNRHFVPEAVSFEDAALRFAEHWAVAEEGEIAVIVTECGSGRQQCFAIDLGSGDAEPCEAGSP